jgi:hypothetical protein
MGFAMRVGQHRQKADSSTPLGMTSLLGDGVVKVVEPRSTGQTGGVCPLHVLRLVREPVNGGLVYFSVFKAGGHGRSESIPRSWGVCRGLEV